MTWFGRIGLVVLPPLVYFFTYRICVSLQRSDREVLEHGIETGTIKQLPNGAFIEVHQPLGPVDDHGHPIPLEYAGAAVPKQLNNLGYADQNASGVFSPDSDDVASRRRQIEHDNHAEEAEMLRRLNEANREADRRKGHLD